MTLIINKLVRNSFIEGLSQNWSPQMSQASKDVSNDNAMLYQANQNISDLADLQKQQTQLWTIQNNMISPNKRSTIAINKGTNQSFSYMVSSTDQKSVSQLLIYYSLKFEYIVGVPLLIVLKIIVFFPEEDRTLLMRVQNCAIMYYTI